MTEVPKADILNTLKLNAEVLPHIVNRKTELAQRYAGDAQRLEGELASSVGLQPESSGLRELVVYGLVAQISAKRRAVRMLERSAEQLRDESLLTHRAVSLAESGYIGAAELSNPDIKVKARRLPRRDLSKDSENISKDLPIQELIKRALFDQSVVSERVLLIDGKTETFTMRLLRFLAQGPKTLDQLSIEVYGTTAEDGRAKSLISAVRKKLLRHSLNLYATYDDDGKLVSHRVGVLPEEEGSKQLFDFIDENWSDLQAASSGRSGQDEVISAVHAAIQKINPKLAQDMLLVLGWRQFYQTNYNNHAYDISPTYIPLETKKVINLVNKLIKQTVEGRVRSVYPSTSDIFDFDDGLVLPDGDDF